MSRIYRRSDRITVQIDDIIIKLAPMTLDQKVQVQTAMLQGHKSLDIREATRGMALAIKFSLKSVEGLLDSDNNSYQLTFDANQDLTDACLDDLLNLELTTKLALVCTSMVNGIPTKFTNQKNEPLDGVEIVSNDRTESEKKI